MTLAHFSVFDFQLFDFLNIDATGYWLHLGDFYSSSSCLEVFLIHDERSKHLVKP